MKTERQEAAAAGMYVEFRDPAGNTVGQALYADWDGRPVPAVGDLLASDARSHGGQGKLRGRVVARHFELQYEPDGSPCVWVRLLVETRRVPVRQPLPRGDRAFSQN